MVFFMGNYLGNIVCFYSDVVCYWGQGWDQVFEVQEIYLTELVDIVCPD